MGFVKSCPGGSWVVFPLLGLDRVVNTMKSTEVLALSAKITCVMPMHVRRE